MKIEKFNTLEESLKSQQKTKLIKDFLKSTNSEGVVRIYGDICINVNDIYQYYVLMEKAERDLEQELVIRCNNKKDAKYIQDQINTFAIDLTRKLLKEWYYWKLKM